MVLCLEVLVIQSQTIMHNTQNNLLKGTDQVIATTPAPRFTRRFEIVEQVKTQRFSNGMERN
jgi:hypothetical protein